MIELVENLLDDYQLARGREMREIRPPSRTKETEVVFIFFKIFLDLNLVLMRKLSLVRKHSLACSHVK